MSISTVKIRRRDSGRIGNMFFKNPQNYIGVEEFWKVPDCVVCLMNIKHV